MGLSVRFATLANNFFEVVNSDQGMFAGVAVHSVDIVSVR